MYYWILKKKVSRDIAACRALFIYSFILQEKDRENVRHIYVKISWEAYFCYLK